MRLQYIHVAAAAFLALVFVKITHDQVWHTDVWAHLRFGQYIVQERQLPEREMFSGDFADQERPYLNFQWLAQAGSYLIYELGAQLAGGDAARQLAGGALALGTEHAVLVTLRLLVTLLIFHRLTGSVGTALFGTVLLVVLGLEHLFVHRPQAIGELCFALLFLALTPNKRAGVGVAGAESSKPRLTASRGFEDSAPATLSWRAVVLVPLVMVLWANCHGSFPIGFVVLATFAAGRALTVASGQWLVAREKRSILATSHRPLATALWRDIALRRFVLTLVLSLAAVAVFNPHGPRLFLYSVEMSSHPNIKDMEEWKQLPVRTTAGYLFLASLALLVPLIRLSRQRFTPAQVLLLVGFGLQAVAHARVLVWWSFISIWVALPHLQALLDRARQRGPAARPTFAKTLLAATAVLAGLLLSAPGLWALTGYGLEPERHVTDKTPWQAADYLREEYAKHPDLPRVVFTSETAGDYLFWALRLDPPVRVFGYTHVHLLTPQHWQECLQVKFADARWQEVLDRHNVPFVVVDNLPANAALINTVRAARDRWQIVFDSPLFVAKRR
jgi:hypothetical protein